MFVLNMSHDCIGFKANIISLRNICCCLRLYNLEKKGIQKKCQFRSVMNANCSACVFKLKFENGRQKNITF